jgi:hypothetical protein
LDLDMPNLLTDLAARRPVFHSEADLQHELAWHLREVHPELQVRLEYPLERPSNAAIDILIRNGGEEMALELKYLCQHVEHEIDGERFALKPQGAQDIRRYDVLKDVARMEQFLAKRPAASAAVLVLSNDPSYWTGPKRVATCDAAFALREGRTVTGVLDWADHAGPGTKRGRESSIALKGAYAMNWRHYSRIDGRFGEFRFLYIPVASG